VSGDRRRGARPASAEAWPIVLEDHPIVRARAFGMVSGGVMSCLFRITAAGQTYIFLCAAANMHDGLADSYLSEGNGGTHSEKIGFLLAANVFRAFGMNVVFPGGNSERIVTPAARWVPGGDVAPLKITDVESVFLNIADFCASACRKTWPQFRAALLAALPKGATARGTLYYALSGAEDWSKHFK
jgi:hypothetical protein